MPRTRARRSVPRPRLPGLLSVLVLILSASASLAAPGCEGCRYAHRGDRHEGIGVRQVAGGSFDLVGVEVRSPVPPPAGGDRVHLYFWLPGSETPEIEVRELAANYWMVPDRRGYGAGLQEYSWPRGEVLAPAGLDLQSLHPKVCNRDGTVCFPSLVSASAQAPAGGIYSFVFRSGAGVDVKCVIARSTPEGSEPVRQFRFNEDAGGALRIEWDGRDDQGRPVPAGLYVLKIKGEMLAETLRPLALTLTFLHHA
ncbi:MAG TPA: hypothetical protein VMM92_15865 [Thermoanaerobaculia bacterium]|nr:hypothetical protein [Thermoanaerobaculia bacterium]